MPQLDAITPNPKEPKKLFPLKPKNTPVLSPAEVIRRRRLMWGIVVGVTVVVLVLWFSTLGSRLGNIGGDNSAWNILKQKASDLISVFHKDGDQKIKNININAPTAEDIQYLREQVFPNSSAVTGTPNTNTTVNQNANVNTAANTNVTATNSNVSGEAGSGFAGNTPVKQNRNVNQSKNTNAR